MKELLLGGGRGGKEVNCVIFKIGFGVIFSVWLRCRLLVFYLRY